MQSGYAHALDVRDWVRERVKSDEIDRYLAHGFDFIEDSFIQDTLRAHTALDKKRLRDILAKSLSIETLSPDETAALLNVHDDEEWEKMYEVAAKIKKKVYDNRIVTFAPLYTGSVCVNNCLYCGFRSDNKTIKRYLLAPEEVQRETEVLAGKIGHKRLIVVYGEHPLSDVNYIIDTLRAIYAVKIKTRNGYGQIRRVNVNAAPMDKADLCLLRKAGIGTYQVFQETYHRATYGGIHPAGTIKANYRWRLYCMHRAFEAGIDDVGIGVLFGLYDWRFEVMGLLCHARELEKRFGIGPHTVSFPRLEPALNTPYATNARYKVSDNDLKKLVTIIRLSIPYTGMIITARETAGVRDALVPLGCTQTDASSRIGIGAYSQEYSGQRAETQQFMLADTRTLDELILQFAKKGLIVSFCTAGYRCGRTGKKIMDLLRGGRERQFCKLNAILTFREWLDDFASDATREAGEHVIESECNEVKTRYPQSYATLMAYYERVKDGERDLYF